MKYLWILLLLIYGCAAEEDWRDYLPDGLYQLSYTDKVNLELDAIFPSITLFDEEVVKFVFHHKQDNIFSGFDQGMSITILPESDTFPSIVDSITTELYEGYRFKILNENTAASIVGGAMWIGPREMLERIIDNKKYGTIFISPHYISVGDFIWKEWLLSESDARDVTYFQLSTKDSIMYSNGQLTTGHNKQLQELIALMPSDAKNVLIAPDGAGLTFAQFYLAGEWMELIQSNSLNKEIEVVDNEEYQSFNIKELEDNWGLVDLSDKWILKVPYPGAAKNYIDRFMSGSSLLDRPDIYEILSENPDIQFLRMLDYRPNINQLIDDNDRPDWWLGQAYGGIVKWSIFGEVARTEFGVRDNEIKFHSRIESWLSAPSWPTFGVQLNKDDFETRAIYYCYNYDIDFHNAQLQEDIALAPPIQLLSDKAYPTTQGWQISNGNRLDAPMDVAPTYVYLPAYDEAIILLATRTGRLLAIRPDGSFWQTAQGRSPNREGEPLTQSPVHISGPDYDRIITIDEAGQLIFSDLEGRIITQHDSLLGAKILPTTEDDFIALRQLEKILVFDKKTGTQLDIKTPTISSGELAILLDESGRAQDLLTAQDRTLKRITGDGKLRFIVQLPFKPSELAAIDQDHWFAYHQGTRRWELYNREKRLLTNQRSDLPPKLVDKKLLCVEGESIIVFDLATLD